MDSVSYTISAQKTADHASDLSSDAPERMIQMRCGHFAQNGTVGDQEITTWTEEIKETWTDFLFHFECSVCHQKVTRPASAFTINRAHGWNNWLAQEAGKHKPHRSTYGPGAHRKSGK